MIATASLGVRPVSRLLLWMCFSLYVLVAFASSLAGPVWAYCLWWVMAAAQVWDGLHAHRVVRGRRLQLGVVIAIAIFLFVPLFFLVGWVFGVSTASDEVKAAIVAFSVTSPLFVTIGLSRWRVGL